MLQVIANAKDIFFTDFRKSTKYAATLTRVKEIFLLILENPQNMLQVEAKVEKIFFADF